MGELATRMGGHLVDAHLAYVTTDEATSDPLARSFRVVEEIPYREKPMRAALVAHDVGTLTIKKRGVDIVPEQLVKRLKLKGSAAWDGHPGSHQGRRPRLPGGEDLEAPAVEPAPVEASAVVEATALVGLHAAGRGVVGTRILRRIVAGSSANICWAIAVPMKTPAIEPSMLPPKIPPMPMPPRPPPKLRSSVPG